MAEPVSATTVGLPRRTLMAVCALVLATAVSWPAAGKAANASTPASAGSFKPATVVPLAPGTKAPAYAAGLATAVQAVVDETLVPAGLVIIRSHQFGDAALGFGTTAIGGKTPVSASDYIRVGSITKTMTATIILQLVQEGRLKIDDPVAKFVEGVPNGDRITVAELLNMSSGLYNYSDDPKFNEITETDPARIWKPEELIGIAFGHPTQFEPGAKVHYCNTNYILLGMIMEKVTGQSAPDLFEKRLFAPLGMRHTFLPPIEQAAMPNVYIHGYHYGSFEKALTPEKQKEAASGTLLPADVSNDSPSWGGTAGAVVSTPDDLFIWLDTLTSDAVLDAATQEIRMKSIQVVGPEHLKAAAIYGYGFGILRRWNYLGHGGQITGYNTEITRDPTTGTDIVVVANVTLAPNGTGVASALLNAAMKALPNADTLKLPSAPSEAQADP